MSGYFTLSGGLIPFEVITFSESSPTDLSVQTSTFGPASVTLDAPDHWTVSFAGLGNFPGFYIDASPQGVPASLAWSEGSSGLVDYALSTDPYTVQVWSDIAAPSGVRVVPLGSGPLTFGQLVYELDPPFPKGTIPLGAQFSVPDTLDTLGFLFTALMVILFYWKFPAR